MFKAKPPHPKPTKNLHKMSLNELEEARLYHDYMAKYHLRQYYIWLGIAIIMGISALALLFFTLFK